MIKIKSVILPFIIFLVLWMPVSGQNQKVNANDVLNKAITALGGKEFLLSIKTMYSVISTEMEGRPVQWVTKEMLPNKGAFQIIYNGRVVFQNWYDGQTGYEFVNGEKKQADPAEFKDKIYKKNIFNELDYINPALWTLAMMGDEKVNDEDCYKIKATLKNGEVRHLYFSKTTYYTLREDKVSNAAKDSFNTTLFSNYKKFGNLTFYSVLKFGEGENAQVGKIESIWVNEKISDNDFK